MWNIWKKNKNKSGPKQSNMEFDKNKSNKELSEEFSELEFQWIKGENIGGLERFSRFEEENDLTFVVFKSGSRINKELLNEYMESFRTPMPQPVANPTKTEVNSINYGTNKGSLFAPPNKNSAIYGLLSKQKPNFVDVNMSIKINLPPKELYDVLTTSFDGAEEEIVDYVISSLDIDDIKKVLSDSILNTYYQVKRKITKPAEKEKTES